MSAGPRLSVVVPIFDAAATLPRCIAALAVAAAPDDEIIVADDGSADGGVTVLTPELQERVLAVRSEDNIGRGPIRNLGAAAATGEVLVFVDADVEVHADTLELIRRAFTGHEGRVSLIGAYDDRPAAPGLVSQYRNLLHHHTHHTHGSRATHFWTGLGAVRRNVYVQLGGLHEGRWSRDMEDVEFGHRLVDAGHTVDVLPHIQGTHLKDFSLGAMVRTDLLHRAIPWSTLMLQDHLRSDAFVTSWEQKVSAACAVLLVGSLGVSAAAAALGAGSMAAVALVVAIVAMLGFVTANVPLWRFFARVRGVRFAVAALPLHVLHALLSAAGFAWALTRHVATRARALRPGRRRAVVAADPPPR